MLVGKGDNPGAICVFISTLPSRRPALGQARFAYFVVSLSVTKVSLCSYRYVFEMKKAHHGFKKQNKYHRSYILLIVLGDWNQ